MERRFSILLHAYATLHLLCVHHYYYFCQLVLPTANATTNSNNQQQTATSTTNSNKRQYIHIINFTIRRMKKGERRVSGSTAIIALSLNARYTQI